MMDKVFLPPVPLYSGSLRIAWPSVAFTSSPRTSIPKTEYWTAAMNLYALAIESITYIRAGGSMW